MKLCEVLTEGISLFLTECEEKADSAKNEELEHLSVENSLVFASAAINSSLRLQTYLTFIFCQELQLEIEIEVCMPTL